MAGLEHPLYFQNAVLSEFGSLEAKKLLREIKNN